MSLLLIARASIRHLLLSHAPLPPQLLQLPWLLFMPQLPGKFSLILFLELVS